MADNTLPPEGLSGEPPLADTSERRAFLRRAVGIGVPVILATVPGRSVLAQTEDGMSGCVSTHPSGWVARNQDRFDEVCNQQSLESVADPESTGGLMDDLEQEKQRRSDKETLTPDQK